MKYKKAQVGNMQGFILSIVTIAIVLAIGLIVLQELKTASDYVGNAHCLVSAYPYYNSSNDICANATSGTISSISANHTDAYTTTGSILGKLATVPTWIGIIIVVALAFIVLSFFYGRSRQGT